VEYFGQGGVLAFASGFSKLSVVNELSIHLVVHDATAEVHTNQQVEVGSK
jgi:hypothetical protein